MGGQAPEDIIFYGYLYQEKKCFALDYNDLIKFSLYIFEKNEDIKLKWQKRLEYIMIDEFQDIDEPQYQLMKVLAGYHRNLFIVGDPDQTIYTWRGASVKYLLEFDKDFPDVKTLMMNKNYRSAPEIISAVNSLIDKNRFRMKKDLVPVLTDKGSAVYCEAENAEAEAVWAAEEIKKLAAGGVKMKDIAVLYRAHYLTRQIEDAFIEKKIPYSIYSGVQFFDRAEVKDALSYLRMIAYRDDLSFMRIANKPKRNLGERRMKFLKEYAEKNGCSLYDALKHNMDTDIIKGTRADGFISLIERFSSEQAAMPISELLSAVLDKSGYERMLRTEGSQERLDNLAELKQSIYEYETTCGEESMLEHYLKHIALFTSSDAEDAGDKVKLMTVHAAKGLEFPYVFLIGMNEGVFPSKRTATHEGMEEERRLAFVAMTRAEKGLFVSSAGGRSFDGAPKYPSRFVLDIDDGLLSYVHPPKDSLVAEAREYIAASDRYLPDSLQSMVYPEGTRVTHSIFGAGTVVSIDEERGAHIVKFDDLPTPRAISFKATLERL